MEVEKKSFQRGQSQCDGNHGMELVLIEIRGLRDELREHRSKIDCLREEVNLLVNRQNRGDDHDEKEQTSK